MTSLIRNPYSPTKKIFFLVQTTRLAASFDTSTRSVTRRGAEIFPCKATCDPAFFLSNRLNQPGVKVLTCFSAFSVSKFFLVLDHTKSYIEKIHSIDAELAGHAHKLDVKLQSVCGSGFSLFAVRMLAKPYHLGVN